MEDNLPILIEQRYREFAKLWKKAVRKLSKGAIHDFRTATRRLLAALGLAHKLFHLSELEKLSRRVEKALKAVGPLRDVQVQQSTVAEFEKAERFDGFQKHLRKIEKKQGKRAERKLTDAFHRKIRRDFREVAGLLGETLSALDIHLMRETLEKIVQTEQDQISRHVGHGFSGRNTDHLHHLRIRIKELRYMLEIVHPEEDLGDLRMLQNEIGLIHDFSQLAREVCEWAEDADDREADNIKALRTAIHRQRQRAVQALNKRRGLPASPIAE